MGSKDSFRDLVRAMAGIAGIARSASDKDLVSDANITLNHIRGIIRRDYVPSMNGWIVDFKRTVVWIDGGSHEVEIMRLTECIPEMDFRLWELTGLPAAACDWYWKTPFKDNQVYPEGPDGAKLEEEYQKWVHEQAFEKP